MYIRAKSYGVHMETSWRCVTNWARETNKLCRIHIRPRAADQFVDIVLVSFAPTDRFVLLPATHAMPFETVFRTHTLPTRYECDRFIDRYGLLDSRSGIGTINIIACSCFEKIIDLIIILFASLHDGITSSSHSLPSYKYIRHEAFLISHFRFQFFYSRYVYATSTAIIITRERYEPTFEPTGLFPLCASKREHFHTTYPYNIPSFPIYNQKETPTLSPFPVSRHT